MKVENVEVVNVYAFEGVGYRNGIILVEYNSSIGFGTVNFMIDNEGVIHADTENVAKGDKDFIKKIMDSLMDKIVVDK